MTTESPVPSPRREQAHALSPGWTPNTDTTPAPGFSDTLSALGARLVFWSDSGTEYRVDVDAFDFAEMPPRERAVLRALLSHSLDRLTNHGYGYAAPMPMRPPGF